MNFTNLHNIQKGPNGDPGILKHIIWWIESFTSAWKYRAFHIKTFTVFLTIAIISLNFYGQLGPTFNKRDLTRSFVNLTLLINANTFFLCPQGFSFHPKWCCISLTLLCLGVLLSQVKSVFSFHLHKKCKLKQCESFSPSFLWVALPQLFYARGWIFPT